MTDKKRGEVIRLGTEALAWHGRADVVTAFLVKAGADRTSNGQDFVIVSKVSPARFLEAGHVKQNSHVVEDELAVCLAASRQSKCPRPACRYSRTAQALARRTGHRLAGDVRNP